jgi:hypothetical protein
LAYFIDEPMGMVDALRALRRMGRAQSTPLRERIMMAASVRPMGPSTFLIEHGGGSFSRVQGNFNELKRYHSLVPDGVATGGRRRGGVERLYRAVQFPLFDANTWPVLPKPMRELYSAGACSTFVEEAVKAIRAETMDARADRHLSVLRGLVDQRGWDRIVERIEPLFDPLLEEIKRADTHLVAGERTPIPAIMAFSVFESPREPLGRDEGLMVRTGTPRVSPHSVRTRMTKVMIDPLCMLILGELGVKSMSAKQFYEEFGGGDVTKARVYAAFRRLKELDWLDPDRTKAGPRRRGAPERFYRAARPAIVDDVTWTTVPQALRETPSGAIVEHIAESMREAIEAGTMDARTDRVLVWTPLVLDRLGWERVIEKPNALLEFVREELAKAEARLAKSREEPIPITILLACFESLSSLAKMH